MEVEARRDGITDEVEERLVNVDVVGGLVADTPLSLWVKGVVDIWL